MPRQRSRTIIAVLFFGTLALIAYGSLYPFDLAPRAATHRLLKAVGELSWARSGRGDRIANVLLYAPLGFCLVLWLSAHVRRGVAVVATLAFGVALSFGIEVTQVFITQRVPSWWDVLLNGVGTLVGATAGLTWQELGGRMRTASVQRTRAQRSGYLVLALWIAWRLAPFIPQFSLFKLKAAFATLANLYFSTTATLRYWIWWTLIAQVVFSLVSAQRGTEALLAVIATVLASSLVIVGHAFIPAELLALMLLLPTLYLLDRVTPGPRAWLVSAAVFGLYLYDALLAVTWGGSQGMDLWPFMAWIRNGLPIDWPWLLQRAWFFAALAWALNAVGVAPRRTALVVPLLALAVEVLQMFSLTQRSSITEPALAFAVAMSMRWLDEPRARR